MSTPPALQVLAGVDALRELRERGLQLDRVRAFVGASGGPKWLVLHGLDRVLLPWLAQGAGPVHAVGTSIGSWRAACLATDDPAATIDRLAEAYVEQRYRGKPSPETVSAEGERILGCALDGPARERMTDNPRVHLHIIATRFLHLGAREGLGQTLALGAAVALNALHRSALRASLQRVVFDARGEPGPFAPWYDLDTAHVELTKHNLWPALHASAAIPMVMSGVIDPPGAPPGTYRDGGVSDYHFGREIDVEDGLTLYPHFYPHLIPGWFDKPYRWRRTRGLRRVVLLAPSQELVAQLPDGRIPDRKDFERMPDRDRIARWRQVLDASRRLGDAFLELLERNDFGHARPLPD